MSTQELLTQWMQPLSKTEFQVVVKRAVEGGGVILNTLKPAGQEGKLFLGKAW